MIIFSPQLYVWKQDDAVLEKKEPAADGEPVVQPLSALEQANALRKVCLVPVGSIDILDRESLDELQSRVQVLLSSQRDYLMLHLESLATGV